MYIPPSRAVFSVMYSNGIRNFSIENKYYLINSYLRAYDKSKYGKGSFPDEFRLSKPSLGKREDEALNILMGLISLNSFEGFAYTNGIQCNLDSYLKSMKVTPFFNKNQKLYSLCLHLIEELHDLTT